MALALMTIGTQAKVRLPHLLGNNMVLQQEADARLWGWAKPGQKVKVTASWASTPYEATADKTGKWLVSVRTPKASYTPLSITFDDGEQTTLSGILAGEVWVCAGQSNMEMPMKGFDDCPTEGYNKAVLEANQYKGIHYVKIPSVMSTKPLDDANCEWERSQPKHNRRGFSHGIFLRPSGQSHAQCTCRSNHGQQGRYPYRELAGRSQLAPTHRRES